jgi:hypothetical protein
MKLSFHKPCAIGLFADETRFTRPACFMVGAWRQGLPGYAMSLRIGATVAAVNAKSERNSTNILEISHRGLLRIAFFDGALRVTAFPRRAV